MKKLIFAAIGISALAAAVSAWFFLVPSETDSKFEACKEDFLKKIKTPSTAVFGDYRYEASYNFNAHYDSENFHYHVDFQNPFGATVRKEMTCYYLYLKDGTFDDILTQYAL